MSLSQTRSGMALRMRYFSRSLSARLRVRVFSNACSRNTMLCFVTARTTTASAPRLTASRTPGGKLSWPCSISTANPAMTTATSGSRRRTASLQRSQRAPSERSTRQNGSARPSASTPAPAGPLNAPPCPGRPACVIRTRPVSASPARKIQYPAAKRNRTAGATTSPVLAATKRPAAGAAASITDQDGVPCAGRYSANTSIVTTIVSMATSSSRVLR